jgi:hypothetical protein
MVPWVHHVRAEQKKIEKNIQNRKKEQKRTGKKGTGTK